jgi:hypothetical protein
MKINNKKGFSIFALALLILCSTSAFGIENGNRIVAPGQQFFNKTYNVLSSEWNNWLGVEPIATNPAFDPDGRFCDLNQKGKVWFLASTFGGIVDRTCEIPDGKAIFFSLGGVFISFAPDFPSPGDPCLNLGTAVEKVRCDVNNDVLLAPDISLEATLDGVPINDLFAYRAQSQPGGFTLHAPDPSLITEGFGLPAGDRFPAVSDGYYMYLKPLKLGKHTLNFAITNPDKTKAGVNYTLIITPATLDD